MRRFTVSLLLFFFASTSVLLGQGSVAGSITGIVSDASGAVVPGATITASSTALLQSKTLRSVAGGVYRLEDLAPADVDCVPLTL